MQTYFLQQTVFQIVGAITIVMTFALSIYAFRKRNISGSVPFLVLTLAVLAWLVCYLFETASLDLAQKIFWAKLQFPPMLIVPPAWLVVVLYYTGHGKWIRTPYLLFLAVIPIVTTILVITNENHNLIWTSTSLVARGDIHLLQVSYGLWAWINLAYIYGLIAVAAALLILSLRSSPNLYRGQVISLLIISTAALAWNFAYVFQLDPFVRMDLLPIVYLVVGFAAVLGLFRYRLLEIVPVARDFLLERIPEAVMVLDSQFRIIEINPAAEGLFSTSRTKSIGLQAERVLPAEIMSAIHSHEETETQTTAQVEHNNETSIFEIQVVPLQVGRRPSAGKLIVIRDITSQAQTQLSLSRRDAIFEAISFSATRFLRSTAWETDVQELLERLGQASEVSRVAIFNKETNQAGEILVNIRYEWTANGIPPQLLDPRLQKVNIKTDGCQRWSDSLSQGKLIHQLTNEMPSEEFGVLLRDDVRTLLIMPIFFGEEWWGYIEFDDYKRERRFSISELEALQIASGTLGAAIQRSQINLALRKAQNDLETRVRIRTQELAVANDRLKEDLLARQKAEYQAAQRLRELNALNEATAALLSTLDLDALLGQILDASSSAIDAAEKGMLYLVARDTGALEMRANLGYSDPRIQKYSQYGMHEHIAKAVKERRPLKIDDFNKEEKYSYTGEITEVREIRSAIVAPLILEDQVIGALSLEASRPMAFTSSNLQLLVSFATTATAAIRNAMLHGEIQTQAITDSLTGLYNRRGFEELGRREVESIRRFNRSLAAIILDVDDFKHINDAYGHASGDAVLQTVADRLNENIRKVDLLARYGGDEFTILMPEADIYSATQAAERLRQVISDQPAPTPKGPIKVTISLGVARGTNETPSLEALIDHADRALYQAKETGRDRVEIYR